MCNINDRNNKKIIPTNPCSGRFKVPLFLDNIIFDAMFPEIKTSVIKNIKVNSISNIFIDKLISCYDK